MQGVMLHVLKTEGKIQKKFILLSISIFLLLLPFLITVFKSSILTRISTICLNSKCKLKAYADNLKIRYIRSTRRNL